MLHLNNGIIEYNPEKEKLLGEYNNGIIVAHWYPEKETMLSASLELLLFTGNRENLSPLTHVVDDFCCKCFDPSYPSNHYYNVCTIWYSCCY